MDRYQRGGEENGHVLYKFMPCFSLLGSFWETKGKFDRGKKFYK